MALNKSMTTGASAAYANEGPAPQPMTALHCGHLIDTAAILAGATKNHVAAPYP
jgi:hypothetical protein